MSVFYEDLTPSAFRKRLAAAPVAYLPLGTLEWHGEHLPLGTDLIISRGFFASLAERVGGIVLPGFFLGPDRITTIDGSDYIGMDTEPSPPRHLDGSAYWVPDGLYTDMLFTALKQLKRAGFKVVVAHGHGPSTGIFAQNIEKWEQELALQLLHCWHEGGGEGIQTDHAGINETSLTMLYRPKTVQLSALEEDELSGSMFGGTPFADASAKRGEKVAETHASRMEELIKNALGGDSCTS